MKCPADYASTGTEHAHQTALFMWANMATQFGLRASFDPNSYTEQGVAQGYKSAHSDLVPELFWLFAIKNAGHGDAIRGNRSRAEGVKSGVPDICLPVSKWGMGLGSNSNNSCMSCGLYIELKRPTSVATPKKRKKIAGTASDKQTLWGEHFLSQGYDFDVCYGWEDARERILKYLGRVSYVP